MMTDELSRLPKHINQNTRHDSNNIAETMSETYVTKEVCEDMLTINSKNIYH